MSAKSAVPRVPEFSGLLGVAPAMFVGGGVAFGKAWTHGAGCLWRMGCHRGRRAKHREVAPGGCGLGAVGRPGRNVLRGNGPASGAG